MTTVFITLLTTTTLFIETTFCAHWLLVLTLCLNGHLWHYCYYENKIRHDISPVFTGIPVFLSCQRSFLWKSQNRFKNLGDFYGGGGVYLLGDLSDWPSFVSIEYLVTMFYQPIAYVLTVHPLSLTITLIVLRYHKITVLSMSHSHRITKLCREDSFLR